MFKLLITTFILSLSLFASEPAKTLMTCAGTSHGTLYHFRALYDSSNKQLSIDFLLPNSTDPQNPTLIENYPVMKSPAGDSTLYYGRNIRIALSAPDYHHWGLQRGTFNLCHDHRRYQGLVNCYAVQ